MPGPRMGPRPPDFDEAVIRCSPTFIKWSLLEDGATLRYACRDFVKGRDDDEERLMRRIMIARRNNIRDHQTLKQARKLVKEKKKPKASKRKRTREETVTAAVEDATAALESAVAPTRKKPPKAEPKLAPERPPEDHKDHDGEWEEGEYEGDEEEEMGDECDEDGTPKGRKRRSSALFNDVQVAREMDVDAVEATRSYKAWCDLPDGAEFIYNQKYIKGRDGADWLLRKNIWRRMRYRRENKEMVQRMMTEAPADMKVNDPPRTKLFQMRVSKRSAVESAAAVATAVVANGAYDSQSDLAAGIDVLQEPLEANVNQPVGASAIDVNISDPVPDVATAAAAVAASVLDQQCPSLSHIPPAPPDEDPNSYSVEAVEAAVAVAESYAKSPYDVVHNPLDTATATANSAALDAAARLAAAAATVIKGHMDHDDEEESMMQAFADDATIPLGEDEEGQVAEKDEETLKSVHV